MDLSNLLEAWGETTVVPLAGLLIGTLFGAFAQRSRFCLRSAVIEFWNRQGTAKVAIWLCDLGRDRKSTRLNSSH